jgi:hypothetical protein
MVEASNPQFMLAVGTTAMVVVVLLFSLFFSSKLKAAAEKSAEQHKVEEFDYSRITEPERHNDDVFLKGKSDKYEWTQSEDELEVTIPLIRFGDTVHSNEVHVEMTPRRLKVVIRREVFIDGEFYAPIRSDDSVWLLDNNTVGNPHIVLNLEKVTITTKNQHWKSLIKGDAEINVGRFGPPIEELDASDPDSVREAIRKVCQNSIFLYLC